jgi:hypothetical protein
MVGSGRGHSADSQSARGPDRAIRQSLAAFPPAGRVASSRRPAIRPHSNEIIVGDRPNVGYTECEQRLGPTGGGNEFDLKTVWLVNLHDSAKVALAKAALWEFSVEDHDVKSPVSHRYPSGYAVTNRGTFSTGRTIQTLTTPAERFAWPTNGARAVILGWLVDVLALVKLSLWGVTLDVDPIVTQILHGAKLVILFVDVVLLVTFIGTSGWLLGKEIIGWARC